MYLSDGEVVFATSNQRIDRLGPCLARHGALSLEELHAANREARSSERFGKTLVTGGYLKARRLWEGIRYQLEEIVWSMMGYEEGVLAFWEGEVAPDNLVRIDFNTRELLERGKSWRDELQDWIDDAAGEGVQIWRVEGHEHDAALEGIEAHITDVLMGSASLEELCRRTGLDLFTIARTLRLLEVVGIVEIRRLGDDPDSTQRSHDLERAQDTQRRLGAANRCIESILEQVGPVDVQRALATRARVAFEEIAARFPGAFADLELTPELLLPADLLCKRLLEAPRDLWRDAIDAVGELLDYLEFEFVNHSPLESPTAFLETLRPLREQATR